MDTETKDPETKDPEINEDNKILLKLGDIIEIDAPTNTDINDQTFIIDYIDQSIIVLLNVSNLKYTQLNVNDEGHITDESIHTIYLLNRSDEEGYARQNGLLPKIWLDIHIGGEFPTIITGEITNLEQDMIEVTTFPDLTVVYIDFGYQGIPRNIPFEKFEIRPKPAVVPKGKSLNELRDDFEEGEVSDEEGPSMSYSSTGEMVIDMPEGALPDRDINDILDSAFLSADDIVFGEELEDVTQLVELPENQRKYGIEVQANDLMDELLSTIPNSQRSKELLGKIHDLIERFKQVRSLFSRFDENGNVIGYIQLGALHKPLIERIQKLDTKIKWVIPVVKQKRFMYGGGSKDDELYDDVNFANIDEELKQTDELFDNYKKSTLPTITNKYENLYSKIDDLLSPVSPEKCDDCLVSEIEVFTNLDSIINNLDDFYSTSNKTNKRAELDTLVKQRFVIQRYNLGMNIKSKTILRSGKIVYVNKPMTPNDKISINSLLILPEPVVKFSHIDLPGTNLITKSNLHMNYLSIFRLLKEKTEVNSHIVDNLEREIKYLDYNDDDEKDKNNKDKDKDNKNDSMPEFLSNLKEYSLDESLQDKPDKFRNFLNVIVPKTRLIFRLIRKYIKDKLSLVEIVKELEPFMIYSQDITYQQYNEIRFYIKNRIMALKKDFADKTAIFRNMRKINYGISPFVNKIKNIMTDNKEFFHMFEDAYNMKNINMDTMSNSELLTKIITLDGARLFSDIITTMVIKILSTPEILDAVKPANIDDMSGAEKIRYSDCARRYLTKKYEKLADLRADNGVDDVFYDKEFDNTPYNIIDAYRSEQKDMEPVIFSEFLTKSLIHKHEIPEKEASELAATLIEGKRRVKNGEFAVLELTIPITEKKRHQFATLDEEDFAKQDMVSREFFRRSKNNWIHETSISEEAFLDTNTIFCNITDDCFQNQKKNVCESTTYAKSRLNELEKKRMQDEFDGRINESIEKMDEAIKITLKTDFKNIIKKMRLLELQREKYNNVAYEIGKYTKNENAPGVVSPHTKLRDMIHSQDDFQKRQNDLVKFVDMFCREPMLDELKEDIQWLYCKDTNTKLVPQSIYKLARVFISGGDYVAKLDAICRTNGIMSDDGDSIVDKFSGYVLRKIDFASEDGFNEEGFRIISNEIMEDDLETKLSKVLNTTAATNKLASTSAIFENEKNQIVYNIIVTVCNNIGIPIETIQDFVLRTVDELMEKNIQSEEIYEQRAQLLEKKKGVRPIPYEIYKNRLMFWIIGSCVLISIQTAVPSFQVKKTFPGCVRSFSGFPLDGGVEDLSGIEYIACTLYKSKSSISPWNSIERLDVAAYVTKIRETIEKLVLPERSDINEMYVKKREFILLHPNEIVPEEHSINRWKLFLPPIVPVGTILHLHGVSDEFEKEIVNLVNKEHRDQRRYLGIVQQKIIQYGYAIVDEINKIVKSKDALLKTSSQIPFLENACCNTGDLIPMQYFINENPNINAHIKLIKKHTEIIHTYREISSPYTYHHQEFTGIHYSIVTDATRVENIYDAYFHYCNFNNDIPIPGEYRTVCPEKPPFGYKKEMSLMDKIEFLKINGKQYTEENLQQLMVLVRAKNIVEIGNPMIYQQVDVIRDLLDRFEHNESLVIDANFRKHLGNVLSGFHPQRMVEEPRPELDKFKDYLVKANERMYYAIVNFIDKHANLSDSAFGTFQDWLLNIFQISDIEKDPIAFRDMLYKKIQYVKNSIYFMSKVLPTMILNQKIYDRIPEHWDLADVHNRDLENFVQEYWKKIQFFFGDTVLNQLFIEIQTRLLDVYSLMMELPVYSPIFKHDHVYHSLFDTETIYFIYTYFLYTTLYEYIVCAESSDLLKTDIEHKKQERRQDIQAQSEESNISSSVMQGMSENLADYDTDMQEINIRIGNQDELKSRVSQLLMTFVDMEKENMTNLMTYDEIAKKIGLSKKQEKKRLTDYLGNMPLDEREIEDQFKKYKMGRWNVGLQKGLVEYDADVYLREREEVGMEEMNFRNAASLSYDVDELDAEDGRDIAAQHDTEGVDFSEYGENYQDGEYYAEDRDPDDFPE